MTINKTKRIQMFLPVDKHNMLKAYSALKGKTITEVIEKQVDRMLKYFTGKNNES